MTYESTVEKLYALGHELASTPSHKFDLAYVRTMLEALDHPERRFASVLIAGTNGKGSTAATLVVHPARRGIPDCALQFAAPDADQRTPAGERRGHQRRRVRRHARARRAHCARPTARRQAPVASQLLRDADRDGVRILRQRRSGDRGARSRHGRPARRDQRSRAR